MGRSKGHSTSAKAALSALTAILLALLLAAPAQADPTRPGPLIEPFSKVLASARAVATDCEGNVYVAALTTVHVYSPAGTKLTSFAVPSATLDLAVDCSGNVYRVPTSAAEMTYYSPSSFPPTGSTTYSRHEPVLLTAVGLQGVAVNPANEHVFVVGNDSFATVIKEFGPPSGGSKAEGECGAGLGLATARVDIDVYGNNGNVYVTANPSAVTGGVLYVLKCGKEAKDAELIREVNGGGGCPSGNWGANPRIAIDQANGHFVEFNNGQPGNAAREYDALGACLAEFGTFSTNVAGHRVAIDNSCVLHDLTEQTTPTCAATYPSNGYAYVAYDGAAPQPYDVSAFGPYPEVEEFKLTVKKTGTGTGKVTGPGIDCGSDCDKTYPKGEEVTLETTADVGSEFSGWSGACTGTGSCKVTMDAAKEVTAEFTTVVPDFLLKVKPAGTGTGTVTSVPSGINCGLDCEELYTEGTEVTLTGTPGANSKAVTWTGCDSVNGENECLVTMSAAKEVTATFDLEQHLLSVSKTGSGSGKVTSSPPGIDCGSDCEELYDHGTVVTLEADPGPGSEFTGFSGACTGTGTCEVTMSAAKSVTANFDAESVTPEFLLSVDVEGTGSGTVTSDKGTISCDPFCSDEYEEGTVVVLTATPDPGSVFVSWKYCDKEGVNGRQCTITVNKAKLVKATFTTTHALEVSRAGSGLGKVQSSPGGILCLANCSETTASFKEGTLVTLKQTPAKHFHFVEWLGDCTGSGACTVAMGEDHSVQAKFAEDAKHLLTLTKSGGGQGTVKSSVAGINCGVVCSTQASAYYQGEVVELTQTPGKGSVFGGWSGSGCSGIGTCTVTMSEAKAVQAEFK